MSDDLLTGEVRRSRSRETGGIVFLIDARVPGDYQENEGGRWVTLCEHGNFVQHETRKLATSFMPVPTEWCDTCRDEHMDAAIQDKLHRYGLLNN